MGLVGYGTKGKGTGLDNTLLCMQHPLQLLSGHNMTATWRNVTKIIYPVFKMVNVQTNMLFTVSLK